MAEAKKTRKKTPRISETRIRDIVKKATTITREGIAEALTKAKVAFNDPLLDGILQMSVGNWLALEDGNYTVKSASAITTLYKISDPMAPGDATFEEVAYDREAEKADPLLKRSKVQAVKAAKSLWYLKSYKATLKQWDALAKQAKPAKAAKKK